MIQMQDFQRQWAVCEDAAVQAFRETGRSGNYILGQEVKQFETLLAARLRTAHAVGVGSGLDALEIALRALGIKKGDRVLTTPLTAFATTLAILRVGGLPVFVDTDESGLMDLDQAQWVLAQDPDLRFLLPVHLYGRCLDLQRLENLKNTFGLKIVEDLAQAIDAGYRDRRAGSIGQFAALSFYPTKNLGTLGDGGAVLTSDLDLASNARVLRDYGQRIKYEHLTLGLNSRLDELHASLLSKVFLGRLTEWTHRRREIATAYLSRISNRSLKMPKLLPLENPVWHIFPVCTESQQEQRMFRAYLGDRGIQTAVHYPVLVTEQPALLEYQHYRIEGELQQAYRISRTEVSLPIHPFLKEGEIDQVVQACNEWNPFRLD